MLFLPEVSDDFPLASVSEIYYNPAGAVKFRRGRRERLIIVGIDSHVQYIHSGSQFDDSPVAAVESDFLGLSSRTESQFLGRRPDVIYEHAGIACGHDRKECCQDEIFQCHCLSSKQIQACKLMCITKLIHFPRTGSHFFRKVPFAVSGYGLL